VGAVRVGFASCGAVQPDTVAAVISSAREKPKNRFGKYHITMASFGIILLNFIIAWLFRQ
jgi:hypothetical protein